VLAKIVLNDDEHATYFCIVGSSNGFCTDLRLWTPAKKKGLLNTPFLKKKTGGETGLFYFIHLTLEVWHLTLGINPQDLFQPTINDSTWCHH